MGGKEIEHHLFETEDHRLKRFFDEDDIKYFFKNFNLNYLSYDIMTSYGPPEKSVIVGSAQK